MTVTRNYIKISLWLSLAISVLVHFSSTFDELISINLSQISLPAFTANILLELVITFLISFLLFIVQFFLLKPFQSGQINKFGSILISLLVSFLIVIILSHYLFMLKGLIFNNDINSNSRQYAFILKDFFIALVVIISVLVMRVINQNQQSKLEIQHLKIENLQRQYDALKSQVSPHFLFNALNSLKTLIHETPDIAQEYLNQLSLVLRYTLQSNENKLVSLQDELGFIDSYFFLIKMRFGNNIMLQRDIKEVFLHYKIPPLALQILIENAVKHNEISKRKPLEITISTTPNGILKVKNSLNTKFTPEPGTGLGLANLSNQYKILSGKEISIAHEGNSFIVELPLLNS